METLTFAADQLRDMLLQRWFASPPPTLAIAKRSLEIEIEQELIRQKNRGAETNHPHATDRKE